MLRRIKYVVMFILLTFCAPWLTIRQPEAPPTPQCAVVVRAELRCTFDSHLLERVYTSPEKLGALLTYLRLLETAPLRDVDPELIAGERYHIRLIFSDGTEKRYQQHSYRYLSTNRHPWQAIDDTYARDLYTLMETLPSDLPD